MTKQEIIDNAPDGATKYIKSLYGIKYYKMIGSYPFFYSNGKWISSLIDPSNLKPL